MKDIMIKILCGTAVVLAVILACSPNFIYIPEAQNNEYGLQPNFDEKGYWRTPRFVIKKDTNDGYAYYGADSAYGAYLAGRVATLRQDFDTASEYYRIVVQKDPQNKNLNRTIYFLLASLGQIDEAAVYAKAELDAGAQESLAPLILAIKDFADGKYVESKKFISPLKDKAYKTLISPMFNAWSYAGENEQQKAFNELDKIPADPGLVPQIIFQKALIADFLHDNKTADNLYQEILQKHPNDVTYRILESVTNFYARQGKNEQAKQIFAKYNSSNVMEMILGNLEDKISGNPEDLPQIIDTPQKGLAEALYSIGTLFRLSQSNQEIAQIFLSASSYLNPDYSISKLAIASILEELGLYKEANRYYKQILPDDSSYFISQLKLAENLNKLKEYKEAENVLVNLVKKYPDNLLLLTDLGNVYAQLNKHNEAIKAYQQALTLIKDNAKESWPIYYVMSASYEAINKYDEAEKCLLEALGLSGRNAEVLNSLGYMWLEQNKNTDDAIRMIMEAFAKSPYEGHIIDSVGFVYYRIGMYDKAVEFLEQAAEMNPGNAVISNHLGDAYWFNGRKNEAIFQWKHALVLKEDADQINKPKINEKIEGDIENNIVKINDEKLNKLLENAAKTANK